MISKKYQKCWLTILQFMETLNLVLAFEAIPQPQHDPKLQKCVSGYCLPLDYKKLEAPIKDSYTTVKIETDIMDVLNVVKNKQTFMGYIT